MGDMKANFAAFCDATKKGSTTATDKTIKKIFTDCKIYQKGMDANSVDIEFRKCIGNARKDIDFPGFQKFLTQIAGVLAKLNKSDAAAEEQKMKEKIAAHAPKSHGTTAASKDAATGRLTDVSGYTGAHKERFDAETGAGKGKSGREDLHANEGYVGNYKGKDTYDKSHK